MVAERQQVRIGIDQATNQVYLELQGKVSIMDWETAKIIGKSLYAKGQQAEELKKAEQVITDGAILHKSGAPFGLTNHPGLKKEIKKEAQWGIGRKVSGAPSREVVGIPGFKSTKGPKNNA